MEAQQPKVFTNKVGGTEIVAPFTSGQQGWVEASAGCERVIRVFHEGGQGRKPRSHDKKTGGDMYVIEPGWKTVEEYREAQQAQSRAWKKSAEGQGVWRENNRRLRLLDRGGLYGGGFFGRDDEFGLHPHAAGA